MIISRFGLHDAAGIPFLIQQRGSQNLISPELRAPFQLNIRPRNARCPHDINLDRTLDDLPSWLDEPLAQALVPTPRSAGPTPMIYDPDGLAHGVIDTLCRMSSPVDSLMRPIWWQQARSRAPAYELTNITPLVWTAGDATRTDEIERHIELARVYGRRILVVCTGRVPIFSGIEWIEPFNLPDDQPLEAIGATLLRRHMENPDA